MHIARLLLIVALAVAVAGCEVVTGIFKAGFWTGLILVVVLVAIIAWIASKFRR